MRSRYTIIVVMVLILAIGHRVNAGLQGWTTAGFGPGNIGPGGYFTFSLKPGKTIFSFRYFSYEEAQTGWFNDRDPNESSREFSFLIGVGDENGKERIRFVAAGLGVVNSVRRGAVIDEDRWFSGPLHEKLTSSTVGVALHGEYYFTKRFGLAALANLNDAEPYVSACLCIRLFGW